MPGILKPKKIYAEDIGLVIDDVWITEGSTFGVENNPIKYGDGNILDQADTVTVKWTSDYGFGQYCFAVVRHKDWTFDIVGLSETMDSNDDKEFARCLLNLLIDKMYVAE